MLLAIQAYIEDYLNNRNLRDLDGYAVRLANLYFYHRSDMSVDEFIQKVRRIETVVFMKNKKDRADLEKTLIDRLDKRFLKKKQTGAMRHLLEVRN
jgi:hypothetical protein